MALIDEGIQYIVFADIEESPVNANEQDGATFNALVESIDENGLIGVPTVRRMPNGLYRTLAGHHTIRALKDLGKVGCECRVKSGEMSPEEEFNLVNNANAIKGKMTTSAVKRVIRANELDPEKLKVHKMPTLSLLPKAKAAGEVTDDQQRRAKIRTAALTVAGAVAEQMVDGRDEPIVVFMVKEKLVAVVKIDAAAHGLRKQVPIFKDRIMNALGDVVDTSINRPSAADLDKS